MDDDFLWDCALAPACESAARDWLVPTAEDERAHPAFPAQSFRIAAGTAAASIDLQVDVREVRGPGVLDSIIGGEVWEAALLLCAFLRHNPDLCPPSASVLELGAGVALPTLMLLEQRKGIEGSGKLTATDNDEELLRSLSAALSSQQQQQRQQQDVKSSVHVSVEQLDWHHPASWPDPSRFTVCIGSALCYSPDHVPALLDTLNHLLLSPNSTVGRVVVVQIADRPGFQRLLQRLPALEPRVRWNVAEVDEGVYKAATAIRHRVIATEGVGEGEGPGEEGNGVVITKRFFFDCCKDAPGLAKQLITTPREDFVCLTLVRAEE